MNRYTTTVVLLALLLSACTSSSPSANLVAPNDQTPVSFDAGTPCKAKSYTVVDDFAGAWRGLCDILADDHVRVTIRPENRGFINDSPWYSFKIVPEQRTTATITLRYEGGHHRYVPKLSLDGATWTSIEANSVAVSPDSTQATFEIPLDEQTVWVSGQELILPSNYDSWNSDIAARSDATRATLGVSIGGLPIDILTTDSAATDVLLLVGRQHPPEVSVVPAFFRFYETLLAETPLAQQFRDRFEIIAIPILNPDGVLAGHWRHNLGGVDLNRDWGPFKQPETKLVYDLLGRLDAENKSIRVFLDFHSTKENVFYTQDDNNATKPPRFTRTWLKNSAERIENYPFIGRENPTDNFGVAKNYIYHRYGIPASTYEVGDETDRQAAEHAAVVFAEELMRLMLEQDYQ